MELKILNKIVDEDEFKKECKINGYDAFKPTYQIPGKELNIFVKHGFNINIYKEIKNNILLNDLIQRKFVKVLNHRMDLARFELVLNTKDIMILNTLATILEFNNIGFTIVIDEGESRLYISDFYHKNLRFVLSQLMLIV